MEPFENMNDISLGQLCSTSRTICRTAVVSSSCPPHQDVHSGTAFFPMPPPSRRYIGRSHRKGSDGNLTLGLSWPALVRSPEKLVQETIQFLTRVLVQVLKDENQDLRVTGPSVVVTKFPAEHTVV